MGLCAVCHLAEKAFAIMLLVYGDESFDETQDRVCAGKVKLNRLL